MPWESHATVVTVGIDAGSESDPTPGDPKLGTLEGLAHYLEHLTFHATRKYPTWATFTRRLDSIASNYNAFTDQSTTLYCMETDRRHARESIATLADVVRFPMLSKKHVEIERERIRQECREWDDEPEERASLDLDRLMFAGTGYAHPILGTERTIARISADHLRNFHRRVYVGRRMCVVVVGEFDPQLIKPAIERSFGRIPAGKARPESSITFQQFHSHIRLIRDMTKQHHCIVGWPIPGINDPRRPILSIIRNLLTGRASSMFKLLLDSNGHGYSLHNSLWSFRDVGYYYIYFPMSADHLEATCQIIGERLRTLKRDLIPASELELAQTNVAIGARSRFSEPWDSATFVAKLVLNSGTYPTLPTFLRQIRSVTRRQVRDVAQQIFDSRRMVGVFRGPVHHLDRVTIARSLKH
jgi:predicted Zn-dependent peptidase